MISCTEFIPAYSELFKYLEEKQGKAAVVDFWNYLSDKFLTNLKDLVVRNGIRGCWIYWSKTLKEEAADFTMELDEEAGEFSITMYHCPSKGRLLECKHIESYYDYCEHCDVLYRRVLEPLGFEYNLDRSQTDQARCRVLVKSIKKVSK
jgi:effector-binding domain-containing protein